MTWSGGGAKAGIQAASGGILLRMAVLAQTTLMRKMGRHNPPPYEQSSKPGEYLALRTGWAVARVMYAPTTAEACAAEGRVRVGYEQSAPYPAIWELRDAARRRKGLIDVVEELRPQLQALAKRA